ncbi:S-formylglutathione hydrolase [Pikeienuella piscinae]|uniref:S-formylglutathione hydrolase n=1 Tax=Pikeienuella piscinae TaxID=2748098 RepID=A0A7M3T5K5_9RHOB|nr:S-formylglutathione hydrolase [Pikeienuella piscinae]
MEQVSESRSFGGRLTVHRHRSGKTNCEMTFAVYLPPAAKKGPVPCLWFLSGLTCTHENAMTKAGAQAHAARHGLALVFPDTSPRGEGVANDEAYDLGQGAGFYLDASEAPWSQHFAMASYLTDELADVLTGNFPIDSARMGVTGHSMGGHGALVLAMKNPDLFRSLSAFAPIAHPTKSDWGRKQFAAYLGTDESAWAAHDATLLLRERGWARDVLIDQGLNDEFLDLLRPDAFAAALVETRTAHVFRAQEGYDHSYNFIASFMEDHVRWHADRL